MSIWYTSVVLSGFFGVAALLLSLFVCFCTAIRWKLPIFTLGLSAMRQVWIWGFWGDLVSDTMMLAEMWNDIAEEPLECGFLGDVMAWVPAGQQQGEMGEFDAISCFCWVEDSSVFPDVLAHVLLCYITGKFHGLEIRSEKGSSMLSGLDRLHLPVQTPTLENNLLALVTHRFY